MLINYLKVAWRNMRKSKTFALINIIGLAAGLACFMLIGVYVADELSYDRFHEKADRIFRVDTDIVFGGNKLILAAACDPLGATLKKDYPQVEAFVRFYDPMGVKRLKKGEEYIRETNTVYADSTLFDVFSLPAIAGDIRHALHAPNTVVISERAALKYFGTTDAVGKIISEGETAKEQHKVTAVIKNIPKNSHFNFDFFFAMASVDYQWGNYLSNNHNTYLLLKPGIAYKDFEKNFDQVLDKYVLPQAKLYMNVNSMDDFKKAGNSIAFSLMPLTRIHLFSDRTGEMGINGSMQYVYVFAVIALLVLLLACINFVNLSTARSYGRAREVGIRKVLGTERRALVGRFLAESVLTVFLAGLVALVMVLLTISWFNDLSGKEFSYNDVLQVKYLFWLPVLLLVVGVAAGAYPAFFLSSFNPIAVLKSKFAGTPKHGTSRSALVVTQFVISIFIMAGTVVVYNQLHFIQTKKIGFDREEVLLVRGTNALQNNKDAFRQEVEQVAGVKQAIYAGFLPVANSARNDNSYSTSPVMDAKNGFNLQSWVADENYIPFMGMKMVSGRNFSKDFATDSNAVVINETAARLMGFGKEAVGKKLYAVDNGPDGLRTISFNIIGVVSNFNFESLRQTIGPLMIRYGKADWIIACKLNAASARQSIADIESKWKTMAPGQPFVYAFMNEWFDDMYRIEQRTSKLGLSFAIIAILIACLGLFGLATFMAEQRTKEIGVRKVLGASVGQIVLMMSKKFVLLVAIAAAVALPLAWWIMGIWLQDFAYRPALGWWVFGLAALLAFVVAILTVSTQAIKAALANPVKSLRTE